MIESLVTEIYIRPVNVLQLVFAFTCLFACLLFWSTRRFRGICLILIIEAALMLFNFSEETRIFQQSWLITPIFTFLHGPAFYLFIKNLVYAQHRWQKPEMLHFMPSFVALPLTDHTQSVLAIGSVSMIIYGLISLRMLVRYQNAIHIMQSNPDALNLRWLIYFMLAFAVVAIQDIVRVNSQPYLDFILRNAWYFIDITLAFTLFLTLIYLGLKQPELFNQLEYYEAHISTPKSEKPDLRNGSPLEHSLFSEIDCIVKNRQLYLQPRLSLLDVAKETGLNVKDISTSINMAASKNFSEYINDLRLTVAVKKLKRMPKEHGTILQVAMESGFNSKSTFNHYFKAQMKMTPGQFIKNPHQ